MKNHVVPVVAKSARRMPDPNFGGAETHYMLVPASEFPVGIPLDANPREPNVNRPVYRDVSRSLRQQDDSVEGTFHLKHRGITVVASAVSKSREAREDGMDVYELHFPSDSGYGIVDGGHSYAIVCQAVEEGMAPSNEYIRLEVMTGLPAADLITEIAGGRNTSIQVQAKSLLDLKNEFQFLKDALAPDGWADRIAWHENQEGDVDVVDIIAIMSCFDIAGHPDRSSHPVDAYRRKASMIDRFEKDSDRYRRLTPVLRDILHLHDLIASDSEWRWQEMGGVSGSGGKYGALEMVEQVKQGRPKFKFPFLEGVESSKRLRRPALFPILASFRLLLVQSLQGAPYGQYQGVEWRDGFDSVKELWAAAGYQLLKVFYEHWESTGRDLHAAGRSPALWGSIYKELAVIDFERRSAN
ncbi:MAG: hypothetical protein F4Z02_14905 [Acidimicrobiia bacterium]|nr:hypothetical protein [Acidimicrobiia bacterium]MYG72377.1 hypothetical protein [Acidimicrobiia bacterium]